MWLVDSSSPNFNYCHTRSLQKKVSDLIGRYFYNVIMGICIHAVHTYVRNVSPSQHPGGVSIFPGVEARTQGCLWRLRIIPLKVLGQSWNATVEETLSYVCVSLVLYVSVHTPTPYPCSQRSHWGDMLHLDCVKQRTWHVFCLKRWKVLFLSTWKVLFLTTSLGRKLTHFFFFLLFRMTSGLHGQLLASNPGLPMFFNTHEINWEGLVDLMM